MFSFWKSNPIVEEKPLTEREKLIQDKVCQSMVNHPDKWDVDRKNYYPRLRLREGKTTTIEVQLDCSLAAIFINDAKVALPDSVRTNIGQYARELVQEKLIRSLDRAQEDL